MAKKIVSLADNYGPELDRLSVEDGRRLATMLLNPNPIEVAPFTQIRETMQGTFKASDVQMWFEKVTRLRQFDAETGHSGFSWGIVLWACASFLKDCAIQISDGSLVEMEAA